MEFFKSIMPLAYVTCIQDGLDTKWHCLRGKFELFDFTILSNNRYYECKIIEHCKFANEKKAIASKLKTNEADIVIHSDCKIDQ